MTPRNLIMAIATVGLLAVTGLATPVAAESGDRADDDRPRAEDRRVDRQERREVIREAHDGWKECRLGNATLNESTQERCMGEKAFFHRATHAVREVRATHGAIAALERQIGRLEVRQMELQDRIDDGNLTSNETAELQDRIAHIDDLQDRLADKLGDLRERLEARHERWSSVRKYIAERDGDDDGDDEDDDEDEGSSSTSSAPA